MRQVSCAYRIVVALIVCVVGLAAAIVASPLLSVSVANVHGAYGSASDCASLGEAAGFAVFSDGEFNASATPGTTIAGRIGAAGDVTLDGVSVGPAAGESGLEVVAGGDFNGGTVTGAGGTVSGGVSYGGAINVAANFAVNGPVRHEAPPFSFAAEFESLRELSSSLAGLGQTAGASVELNKYSGALVMTGTAEGLNVFTVSAAQLTQAAGIIVDLTKPGATALINVTTDTDLAVGPQYMSLTGAATASGVVWNLPLATGLDVTRAVDWQGLILAPNATVKGEGRPQLSGELIAESVSDGDWVFSGLTSTVCLPAPDTSLSLTSLCVNAAGELAMRLRNTSSAPRKVQWVDLTGSDFGSFAVPAESDQYFHVSGGSGRSVIQATSGTAKVTADGTSRPCAGTITVQLVTVGPVPDTATRWDVTLDGADSARTLTLGQGDSQTVTVPGDYLEGATPIDQVTGGEAYIVSVPETHGGVATVSLDPIEVLDGANEIVIVTITYPTPPTEPPPIVVPPPTEPPPIEPPPTVVPPPTEPPPTPPPPTTPGTPEPPPTLVPPIEEPTLPPGAPAPPEGPGLSAGSAGADLTITHQITPRRLLVGGTVETLTRVRNIGNEPAVGATAREVPQYKPSNPNSVARVLSLSTTAGTCTQRRPVRCQLGTLAPGAEVTIRTRTRILVAAALHSIVVVSSESKETNTADKMAIAAVTTYLPKPAVRPHITAPAVVHVATTLRYHVTVTGEARTVRLCTSPPRSLIHVHGRGLLVYRGRYCLDVPRLARGQAFGFTITGLATRLGQLPLGVEATAARLARPARAATHVSVIGPTAACPAAHTTRTKKPVARTAC
ncbi:MAG TPA: choice-of-anchor A family protein [Solirubrobacteraceae bacterium]|nr:choice-of-anchor A family protein [Solirubrobacteraceae bacterium]